MNKILSLLLCTLIIGAFACDSDGDNPCDKIESLGSFSLEADSRAALPYQNTDSRVIFSDSLGQERALNLIPIAEGFNPQEFMGTCESDPNALSTFQWERERVCYELEDDVEGSFSYQICIETQYNITVPFENRVADVLQIEAYSSSSRLQREGDYTIILAPRNFNGVIATDGELELLDEFSWEGRSLNQVFKLESINNIGVPRELYYTKTEGLVAFRDYVNDTFYFFERIE
ncbi:MAG: hypothetical protein AAFO03_02175 [Bacteroidota bacterium]